MFEGWAPPPITSYYSDIHANDLELRGSGYRPWMNGIGDS